MDRNTRKYRDFEKLLLQHLEYSYRQCPEGYDKEFRRQEILKLRIKARNLWMLAGHKPPQLGFEEPKKFLDK